MKNLVERDIDIWVRPWDTEKTDNIYDRDERFFAILVKGVLAWLNKNIILNGKPINHFIFNTGSSYLYLENDGYEFKLCETTGEDKMYMKMPRCIVTMGNINIVTEELSSPYVAGVYERMSSIDNKIKSYTAEIKRLPLEVNLSLQYVLSTTNESLILMQEFLDKIIFQRYFNIIYLGQRIMCSIEFPQDLKIEFNKIDLTSTDVNQKLIGIDLKICTNYPIINTKTEIESSKFISEFSYKTFIERTDYPVDNIDKKVE